MRRDLGELQDAGFDIEIEKRTNRVYAQLADEQRSTVAIAKRERFTLLAIRRIFDVFEFVYMPTTARSRTRAKKT